MAECQKQWNNVTTTILHVPTTNKDADNQNKKKRLRARDLEEHEDNLFQAPWSSFDLSEVKTMTKIAYNPEWAMACLRHYYDKVDTLEQELKKLRGESSSDADEA